MVTPFVDRQAVRVLNRFVSQNMKSDSISDVNFLPPLLLQALTGVNADAQNEEHQLQSCMSDTRNRPGSTADRREIPVPLARRHRVRRYHSGKVPDKIRGRGRRHTQPRCGLDRRYSSND